MLQTANNCIFFLPFVCHYFNTVWLNSDFKPPRNTDLNDITCLGKFSCNLLTINNTLCTCAVSPGNFTFQFFFSSQFKTPLNTSSTPTSNTTCTIHTRTGPWTASTLKCNKPRLWKTNYQKQISNFITNRPIWEGNSYTMWPAMIAGQIAN